MLVRQQKYGNALGREGGWEVPQNTMHCNSLRGGLL
jgi:hypothetical protein